MEGLEHHLHHHTGFQDLPKSIVTTFGLTESRWNAMVVEHSIKRSFSWIITLPIAKEAYYDQLIKSLQNSLLLFPYKDSEHVIGTVGLTPYAFYREMLVTLLQAGLWFLLHVPAFFLL
jgi:hypothetical protein